MSSISELWTVLNVKLALCLQFLQTAESFLTFSARGISYRMRSNPVLKQEPSNPDIITVLPSLAAFSLKVTTSLKNQPSSIPMTSQSLQVCSNSLSSVAAKASISYLSCVAIQFSSYLVSALYLMFRHFFPATWCLLTFLRSSVLLPANMGPMMSSIDPLCFICSGILKQYYFNYIFI